MKMPAQVKLINSLIFIFLAYLIFNSCIEEGRKPIENSALFFGRNCQSCHGINTGFEKAPTIALLNKYDSNELVNKLYNVSKEENHKIIFKKFNYTKEDAIGIYKRLRQFSDTKEY